MLIIPGKRISRKISNSHILWFGESNSWIQLEEPAWFVYRNYNSGKQLEKISEKISVQYGLSRAESLRFVNEVAEEIRKLSSASFHARNPISSYQFHSPEMFFSVRNYKIKGKIYAISFGSKLLDYMIHPPLAQLEIKTQSPPHFRIEAFSAGFQFIIKIADQAWTENDPSLLKRRLFIQLAGLIYGKSDHDWLAFIHGSAVSNEKESIVLSTASGSGKSTLAALLCKSGLKFMSDDYIPVDARYCRAYPFPSALSVKDGALPCLLPLYDQLKDAEVFHFRGNNKTVRYLPFPVNRNFYKPLPVKKLVFVQYDTATKFNARKIDTLEAIRRFHEEAWVSHSPTHAKKFISWFPGLQCFELIYSENKRAVDWVTELFK